MWEYYLANSEVSFRHLATCVFPIQLTRSQDAVPLTRDYMSVLEAEISESNRRGNTRAA